MKKWKQAAAILLAVCILPCTLGCSKKEETEDTAEYYMYYLSPKETALETAEYVPTERTSDAMVKEIAGKIGEDLPEEGYLSLLPAMFWFRMLLTKGRQLQWILTASIKR